MALDFLGPEGSSLAGCGLAAQEQRGWVILNPQGQASSRPSSSHLMMVGRSSAVYT